MIGSNAFNYINVLDKAADAGWIRNELITNNIANATTPNYKRKDVEFESYLKTAIGEGESLDECVGSIDLSAISPTAYVDNSSLSYRLDGNNVDISTENAQLAKNQIRYNTLLDSMTQEFSRIKTVLSRQ